MIYNPDYLTSMTCPACPHIYHGDRKCQAGENGCGCDG